MAKNYIIVLILSIGFSALQAQNLVPNPSFEAHTVCPKELGKRQLYIENWIQPTAGSIDYFHRCSNTCGVPDNVVGYQEALSGDAYIGITVYHERYRVYAQAPLKTPLTAGKIYTVEYNVCLAENSKYAAAALSAYISTDKITGLVETVFECMESVKSPEGDYKLVPGPCRPQINNPAENFLKDNKSWKKISGTFTAKGGEKYITIGNFYGNTKTPTTASPSVGKGLYAYYFIDDVAVYESGTKVEPFFTSTNISPVASLNQAQKNPAWKEAEAPKPAPVEEAMIDPLSIKQMMNEQEIDKKIAEVRQKLNELKQINEALTQQKAIVQAKAQPDAKPVILEKLYFAKNKAEILPQSEGELIKLVNMMNNNPAMQIRIDGHTDESGAEDLNKKLSVERAQAVVNFLVMFDVDATRMTYNGFGSTKPLAKNDTEEGRKLNRRVEFTITKK
ncbi:MAG: OmpA family protein [Bacteroidia bacterium]